MNETVNETPRTSPPEALVQALEAWSQVVGVENVHTGAGTLREAESATFPTHQRVPAVVCPGDREQVQECLRIANRWRIPVYPVSTGKNWGYGSRVPTEDGSVILDLGRMRRIVDFDEDLAYVTVEPGVTQRQLADFLAERSSNLILSVTGGSPLGSLVGNTIERGFAIGYYWDRFEHVAGLEVVLPTGEVIHSGFDRFAGAAAAPVFRRGVGPSIDGLFSQSNLGVVTRMTMNLFPRPAFLQSFYFEIPEDADLEGAIDALRTLTLGQTMRVNIGLGNDFNFLAFFLARYPWEAAGGRTPLPPELRREQRRHFRLGKWNATAVIFSASRRQAMAERRIVKRALKGKVKDLFFLDEWRIRWLRRLHRPYRWIFRMEIKDYMDDLLYNNAHLGAVSQREHLTMPYWRKREPIPDETDLHRDRCGILWYTPVVPYQGRHVRRAGELIDRIGFEHGLEPFVGVRCSRERAVDLVVGLVYDRDVPGEDERAVACHDALCQRMAEEGYLPCRLGLQSMHLLPEPRDDYGDFYRRLKAALDPHHILSPGRYES